MDPVKAFNRVPSASKTTTVGQAFSSVKASVPRRLEAVAAQTESERRDALEPDVAEAGTPATASTSAESGFSSELPPSASEPTKENDESCRKEGQGGDDNSDCGAAVPLPWLLGGAGGLTVAALALGRDGSAAGDTARAGQSARPGYPTSPEVSTSQPGGSPTPADPATGAAQPLLGAPRLTTSTGRTTVDPAGHVDVQLTSPENRWVYRLDDSKVWLKGEGKSIPAEAISTGVHAVTVAQVDDQGRIGEVATIAVRVHAANVSPALALVNDTGLSQTDGWTQDGTIAVTGLANDSPWYYRVNGSETWIPGANGRIPSEALTNGTNVVEVYQPGDDPETELIKTLTVQLDQTAPEAAVLSISGSLPILNASGSVNLSNLETGSAWEWRLDGGDWHQGRGSSLPSTDFHQGTQMLDVRLTDVAGNVSDIASLQIAADFSTPGQLSASVLKANGTLAANNLINAGGQLAIGGLDPGAHWEFKVGDDDRWRQGVDGGILVSRYFDEGTNTIQLRQVNEAGNAGLETTATLTLDTIAPVINFIPINANSYYEQVPLANLNMYSSFRVAVDTATTVEFAGQTYQLPANASYVWTAGYLKEGANTLVATATDDAGNTTTRTIRVNYRGTPPAAPVVSLKNDTGDSSTDRVTADGTLVITNLFRYEEIRHSEDNGLTWSSWSTSNEIASSAFGADGEKNVLVQTSDSFGNISASTSFHFTLDSTVI